VASLRLVSPGAVTNGVILLSPQKVMTFLVISLPLAPSPIQVIPCSVFF